MKLIEILLAAVVFSDFCIIFGSIITKLEAAKLYTSTSHPQFTTASASIIISTITTR